MCGGRGEGQYSHIHICVYLEREKKIYSSFVMLLWGLVNPKSAFQVVNLKNSYVATQTLKQSAGRIPFPLVEISLYFKAFN